MNNDGAVPDNDNLALGKQPSGTASPKRGHHWISAFAMVIAIILVGIGSAYATWSWFVTSEAQRLSEFRDVVREESRINAEHEKIAKDSEDFENSDCYADGRSANSVINEPKCFTGGSVASYHVSVPGAWIQSVEDDTGGADLLVGHPDASIRIEVSSRPSAGAIESAHLVELSHGKSAVVSVARKDQTVEFTLNVLRPTKSYVFRARVSKEFFETNHDLIWAVAQTFSVVTD